uniref:Uncharacterized protein n=1 Tax=Timema genevievae TaxID=629358 RepID=A0A7R9PG83_TIMGE|nr:unnamed protein product [Timema genevievae]
MFQDVGILPPLKRLRPINVCYVFPSEAGYGWTHLAVSVDVDAGTVTLIQDCQPPRQQPLAGSTAASSRVAISIPDDALVYFRQEPGFKKKFLLSNALVVLSSTAEDGEIEGTMQVAKIQPLTRKNHLPWICEAVPKKQHYITQQ